MAAAAIENKPPPGSATAVLEERYEIRLNARIPVLDRGLAEACEVCDRHRPELRMFALVCKTLLPLRFNLARELRDHVISGLLPLQAFGVVEVAADVRFPVLVYERPAGHPVMAMGEALAAAEEASRPATRLGVAGTRARMDLARRVLRSVLPALMTLEQRGFAHRSIRPQNLWLANSKAALPVLGCGVCGPAAFDQPSTYEPLERATAAPVARGEGSVACDVYALGVTVLALVTGDDPGQRTDQDAIFWDRLERGSYEALTDGLSIPDGFEAPLQGMLADEEAARWTLREVDTWLASRRTPARVSTKPAVGSEPLSVEERELRSPTAVAQALSEKPRAGARIIRDGRLESWLRRSVRNAEMARQVAGKLAEAGSAHLPRNDEKLVARVIMALDPGGTIRFRELSFAADGLASLFAAQFLKGSAGIQALAEVMTAGVIDDWLMANAKSEKTISFLRQYERCIAFLDATRLGKGIERCLYDLNPSIPCFSPLTQRRYVTALKDMLPAIEHALAGGAAERPMDRHVVAFAAARSGGAADALMNDLADGACGQSVRAMVAVFAWLHKMSGGGACPALLRALNPLLPAAIADVYRRDTRQRLEKKIQQKVDVGDIRALHEILEDPHLRKRDEEDFLEARQAYRRAEAEIAHVTRDVNVRIKAARIAGRRIAAGLGLGAAFTSVVVALASVLIP